MASPSSQIKEIQDQILTEANTHLTENQSLEDIIDIAAHNQASQAITQSNPVENQIFQVIIVKVLMIDICAVIFQIIL